MFRLPLEMTEWPPRHPESARVGSRDALESNRKLFRREGGDDFFEARIAAQRIPKGEQLQGAVVGNHISSLRMSSSRQLLQGELLLTGPGGDDGEIDKHSASVHGISVHREKLDRAPAFA